MSSIDLASVGTIGLDPEPQPYATFKAVLYDVLNRRIIRELNVELTYWTNEEKFKATTPFDMFIPVHVEAPKTFQNYVFLFWKYDNVEERNNVIYADKETTYYAYYGEISPFYWIFWLLLWLLPLIIFGLFIFIIGKLIFSLLKKKKEEKR